MNKAASAPAISFDPERTVRRLKGALRQAGVKSEEDLASAAAGSSKKQRKKIERAMRRAAADLLLPIAEAERLGATLPPVRALLKTSWRLEVVDVPQGEKFIESRPAWVVRFDGNAPLERLRRAGVLDDHHVRAGEKVCALYLAAVKPPRVTGSYDGIVAQGGAAPRPWIETGTDAWKHLDAALRELLQTEATVVLEVAVYETPIETLAKRRDLVRLSDTARAKGAIVQSLFCGLSRLSRHWGLDAGQPQNVAK